MDGLNFKLSGDLTDSFDVDKYGSYIPNPDYLQVEAVTEKVKRQLSSKTGFYARVGDIVYNSDVKTALNPYGNTPAIGVGVKLIGKRPLNVKSGETLKYIQGRAQQLSDQLSKRERKIEDIQSELYSVYKDCETDIKTDGDQILYEVESDQVNTGGGFDGGTAGDVTASALNFLIDGKTEEIYRDSELSRVIVESCLRVKQILKDGGMKEGEIKPTGASVVRAMQDNDGMFGYPVYAPGNDPLTKDLATRLLLESGVDTRGLVGSLVTDTTTKVTYPYRVIDAGGFILDNKVFTYADLNSLVTILVRTQKHGWERKDDGSFSPKKPKVRSVYPNAFLPAIIEGMIADPFNRRLQDLKISFLPSLQDKPTRVDMIKRQILDALQNGYDYLAADWSKYDATVQGGILATVIQLVVKPFIHADYYYWIDAMTYILTYKYLLLDSSMCNLNPEKYKEATLTRPYSFVQNYVIFGSVDGLISGAKFTHVGGSLYGEVVIHHAIPLLLGFEPMSGPQAGDDTLMAVPLSTIDISSSVDTYTPIINAASKFGLKANASKQIWHNSKGEVVKVFLQESYHSATDVWGVGSIFRPMSAIFYSEREKHLSVAEQLMAEIARANQGADSPFVDKAVEWWLSKERYIGWLFKNYGRSGFQELVKSIGKDFNDLKQSIDVGSFSFGVSSDDLEHGSLEILDVLERVASNMTFSSEDKASFLEDLNPGLANGDFLDESDLEQE